MQSQINDGKHRPLGRAIRDVLQAGQTNGPSIGEMTAAVGEKGFGLLFIVLALPSALPVPAPGYSTPFGVVIALVALQIIFGRSTIWLPARLKAMRIRPGLADKMLGTMARTLGRIERFVRPRQKWIQSRSGLAALATVILLMAVLMILPIPLTNTLPAMVVFILGIGLSEEDGMLAIAAFLVGCFALLLYAGVIYLLVTQGPEAIDSIKDSIKELWGLIPSPREPGSSVHATSG